MCIFPGPFFAGTSNQDFCAGNPTISSITNYNWSAKNCGAQVLQADVTLSGSIPAGQKMQVNVQLGTSSGSYSWNSGWADKAFSGSGPNTVTADAVSGASYEGSILPDVTLYYRFEVRIVSTYDETPCTTSNGSESNDDGWQTC